MKSTPCKRAEWPKTPHTLNWRLTVLLPFRGYFPKASIDGNYPSSTMLVFNLKWNGTGFSANIFGFAVYVAQTGGGYVDLVSNTFLKRVFGQSLKILWLKRNARTKYNLLMTHCVKVEVFLNRHIFSSCLIELKAIPVCVYAGISATLYTKYVCALVSFLKWGN